MSDNETIADIIAEARDKYTVHECNQCSWRKCCSKGFGSEECGKFRESIFLRLGIEDGYFTQLLDRLEAAHKRERGDCAKLREALVKAQTALVICEWPDGTRMEGVAELLRQIDAALAEPPRNCDRFKTAAEAIDAYQDLTGDQLATDSGMKEWVEFAVWLFAPATEGVAG